MSVLQSRGGIPAVFRDTINTTGREHNLPFFTSYLVARNQGAQPVRMYFREEDFDANANYVVLPTAAATTPHGEWSGPVEAAKLWFRAQAATAEIEVVSFQRRG